MLIDFLFSLPILLLAILGVSLLSEEGHVSIRTGWRSFYASREEFIKESDTGESRQAVRFDQDFSEPLPYAKWLSEYFPHQISKKTLLPTKGVK